ncbi:cuticle protein 38-like [Ixodes scapularis]|uniref:cuticle protein 38-like n=1 Tax=Ixodes scapularis TaxID=6945 RepID=UPI001C3945CF|nr:cuticle protein 38-like [Ixodes scapularis]
MPVGRFRVTVYITMSSTDWQKSSPSNVPQFRACLLVALVSCALAGYASPLYGYSAPVAAYHAAPVYTRVAAPAVTAVHHGAAVSHVSSVSSYRSQHPVATPVARYASVHTAPAVATVHTFRACLLVALASCAFAGYASPFYGYRAPVAAYHAAPVYSRVVAPAVTAVHHGAAVSHVSSVSSYRSQHPVATPVARYASVHTAPAVATVHTVPAVAKVAAYAAPVLSAVHAIPTHSYGYTAETKHQWRMDVNYKSTMLF